MNRTLLRSLALAGALTAGFLGSASGISSPPVGTCNYTCRSAGGGLGTRFSYDTTYLQCCQTTPDCPPGSTGTVLSWVGGSPARKMAC